MKLLHLNMYKKIKYIAAILILLTSISVDAQVTSQSPYSGYGIGNFKGSLLPQLRAMGGISTGVFRPGIDNLINLQNPATYSGINLATIDIAATGTFTQLKQSGVTEKSFNSTLSHIALAFPIVRGKTGMSFGILPYTELGYKFNTTAKIDTNTVNYPHSGEGGLTKAYIGLGQQIGDHFRIGGNVEYLFGNLMETVSTELETSPAINSRIQNKNSVGGISFSYGAQYEIPLTTKSRITLGYSGSSSSTISSNKTQVITQYLKEGGVEKAAFDTVANTENNSAKLKLPLIHNFGVSIQKDDKWMVGADFRTGKWSKYSLDGATTNQQNLQDSWGVSLGGQITPDITSIGNYFKRVDYRFGVSYDKSYIKLANGDDVKQMGISFGLGLPLAPNVVRTSFYKMNITAELGKMGSVTNGNIEENYLKIHLGFTLNDRWFRRFKLD
ncbi:outer membrane protein transport protein [Pedobacter sp. PWIIR3]